MRVPKRPRRQSDDAVLFPPVQSGGKYGEARTPRRDRAENLRPGTRKTIRGTSPS